MWVEVQVLSWAPSTFKTFKKGFNIFKISDVQGNIFSLASLFYLQETTRPTNKKLLRMVEKFPLTLFSSNSHNLLCFLG